MTAPEWTDADIIRVRWADEAMAGLRRLGHDRSRDPFELAVLQCAAAHITALEARVAELEDAFAAGIAQGRELERAAVVAWLKEHAHDCLQVTGRPPEFASDPPVLEIKTRAWVLTEAIAAGEHRKGGE